MKKVPSTNELDQHDTCLCTWGRGQFDAPQSNGLVLVIIDLGGNLWKLRLGDNEAQSRGCGMDGYLPLNASRLPSPAS